MISPRLALESRARRRHFAFSTIAEVSELSSIKIGASARRAAATASFGKSRSPRYPARAFELSTRASEQRSRSTSCSLDISSEKKATPRRGSASVAAYAAMLSASAVLPIEGRAAITTRSAGCRPAVMRSRSVKPVGTPVTISLRS